MGRTTDAAGRRCHHPSLDMAHTDESIVARVTSRDGTEIGYWTCGEGPPLVLVHGAPAGHSRWGPLLPSLEPHATVHAMDRRGRGQRRRPRLPRVA
jgi:pimeloyl-ACP methyl ester carboxylesterase